MSRNNSSRYLLPAAAFAMLFGATAVHAETDKGMTGTTSSQSGKSMTGATTDNSTASVNKADQMMMRDLAYANLAEIEAAKIAQSKSQNEEVKSFAQKMIDDHTKAQQDLQQLAQSKNVTLPTTPDSRHQSATKKLNALSEPNFDRQYLAQGGLSDHKATHSLLQRIQTQASDADLKQLASRILPTVDQHLEMAQKTQNTLRMSSNKPATISGAVGETGGTSGRSSSGTSSGTSEKSDTSGASKPGTGTSGSDEKKDTKRY
jgi:putative membrane protein